MASSVDKQEIEEVILENQVENMENKDEIVSCELPAPDGWKKFLRKKSGTPKRNEVVFISPTGEEIKNKKQLDLFLKAHPGGPPSSAFNWGDGYSPRRSPRISEKSKATETPENEPVKKREKKSSSKKGAKEDNDDEAPNEGQDGAAEEMEEEKSAEEVTTGEAIETMKEGGDVLEAKIEETIPEKKTESTENPEEADDKSDSDVLEAKIEETILEKNHESTENPEEADDESDSDVLVAKIEETILEKNTESSESPEEADDKSDSDAAEGVNEEASAEKEVKAAEESSEKDAKVV